MENKIERRQEMFRLIEEWKTSGKSKKQFCEEHQIAQSRFFYWQKRYSEQNESIQNCFVPVKTGKKKNESKPGIDIYYPNGVRLQLPAGTGVAVIRSMIGLM